MTDLIAVLTATAVLLTAIFGGFGYLFTKIKECEEHRKEDETRMTMLAFFVARDGRAVRKLFHAMIEVAPHHPTLTDVSHILRETFDPNADAPDRFQDLLDKLATVPSNRSGA